MSDYFLLHFLIFLSTVDAVAVVVAAADTAIRRCSDSCTVDVVETACYF